jgi:hypothetical protein
LGEIKFFTTKKEDKKADPQKKGDKSPDQEKKILGFLQEKNAAQPAAKPEPKPAPVAPAPKPSFKLEDNPSLDAKIRALVELISHDKDHALYPYINYETNKVTFPLLAKVGESEDNIGLLEKLSDESIGVLDKHIFERLILCPEHSDSYAISLRLYCGKCGSLDVDKLHLIEHKACGYIGKKSEFETATQSKCPSCRMMIRDPSRELRIPGMWYECNGCTSKFDNPTIKLHCRKYNHDFNMNQAETVTIPFFRLTKDASTAQVNILSIIPMVKKVLSARDFAIEETAQIKGKSGVMHTASLYAYNREGKTILIDIRSAEKEVDDAEVISAFVKVIDVSPNFAIFVAIPGISEKAKAMSANYSNISIVSGKNFAEVIKSVEQVLTKQLPPAESQSALQAGPKRID